MTAAPEGGHHLVIEDPEPACPACEIRMRSLGVLGAPDDARLLREFPGSIIRDSRGQVYAVVPALDHEVLVYDPDGGQRRTLGSLGEGPGEYRRPLALALGPGDSVYLAHDGSRMTVFDPDGELVRTFRLPGALRNNFLVESNGHILMAGAVADPEPVEAPLHLLSPEGHLLRSFGDRVPLRRTPSGGLSTSSFARVLFAAAPESFWVTEPFVRPRRSEAEPPPMLRLSRYNVGGELGLTVDLRPPADTRLDDGGALALGPRSGRIIREVQEELIAMGEGSSVLLQRPTGPLLPFEPAGVSSVHGEQTIVVSRFQRRDLDPDALEFERPGAGRLHIAEESLLRIYSTLIDVVDLNAGLLLVRWTVPGYGWLLQDGTLVMMRVSDEGIFQLELFELVIEELAWERTGS